MANATTYPSDGRITSLTTYVGPMNGAELFLIVSPPNPALAVNYNLSATTLATFIVGSFPVEPANSVFAGPSIGTASATPTFRSLVPADLPQGTAGLPLVGNGVATAPLYEVLGLAGGGLNTTTLTPFGVVYGNGTSTVGITAAGTTGYVLTGNGATTAPSFQPIGTGSFTGVWPVSAGGSGTASLSLDGLLLGQGTSPVAVVAATTAALALISNGSASAPSFQLLNLTASVTGVLSVPSGGSGTSALSADGVIIANGTSPFGVAAATTAGYSLVSNGSATAPSFQAMSLTTAFVTGVLSVVNGGIGTATLPLDGVVLGNGTGALKVVAAATSGLVLTAQGTTSAPIWSAAGAGNVTGPASATTNDIATFANATTLLDSGFTLQSAGAAFGRGYVNKFRNPAMDVAQRGVTNSIAAGSTSYTVDGWQVSPTGTSVVWTWVAETSTIGGSVLRLTAATAITACTVQQRIESYVAQQMIPNGATPQPVTVQWVVYNSTGTAFVPLVATQYPTSIDNFSSVTSDLASTSLQTVAANGFTVVSYTFTPNSNAKLGYQIQLLLGAGLATASGTIDISRADVRLTPGVATGINNNPPGPELRPIGSEFLLCQRYFVQLTATVANEVYTNGFADSATSALLFLQYPAIMRTTPSLAFSAASTFQVRTFAATIGTGSSPPSGAIISNIGVELLYTTGVLVQGGSCFLRDNGTTNSFIQISAEL